MKTITVSYKGQKFEAFIDDDDFENVSAIKWGLAVKDDKKYPYSFEIKESLHRFIMGCKRFDGKHVDHVNGNTLDCTKCNLRVCTRAQNMMNRTKKCVSSSGYKGVSYHKRDEVWNACISVNGKSVHIGSFSDERMAALAYDQAAIRYHGEFAKLNFEQQKTLNVCPGFHVARFSQS